MAVTDSPGPGRVLVALSDGPLVAEPTWTRYDEGVTGLRCYGFDCFAGRQSELDTTDTGTATVYFHDLAQVLDDDDLIGLQVMLQLYNPVADEWQIRWRGHIDDIGASLVDVPNVPLATTSMTCVGIFDYLGGCKMLPGVFGSYLAVAGATPAGMESVVFYEDGDVQTRIIHLFTDAGLDPDMFVAFTGNVDVNETLYDAAGDVILQALRDAADAEFPGVANVYEDRFGRAVFHGRKARFTPELVAASASDWDFMRWYAATREDVTSGVAQIREFGFNRPRARIINSYIAYPRADENGVEFDRTLIPTLVKTDPTSISDYGYRGAEAPDLIIKKNFNNDNSAFTECGLFGDFYTSNYNLPRKAIQQVVFRSMNPEDARADANWDLMCRADISDAINLTVDEAQLADEPYFIDGISVECRVLNADFDDVTVTPNLTPASYYGTDVFNA